MCVYAVLEGPGRGGAPATHADVAAYIAGRLRDADADPQCPPYESVREYAYEGDASTPGSLSSVGSTTAADHLDYDDWAAQIDRLAGPYTDHFNHD